MLYCCTICLSRVILTRPHAMLFVRDKHLDPILEHWCSQAQHKKNFTCFSDEMYLGTLLASYNAGFEVRERAVLELIENCA